MDSVLTRRGRFQHLGLVEEKDHFFRVLVTCLALEADYNFPQASNPRDRVFALLNLASDVGEFSRSFIDYTKSCEQVYTETAMTLLNQGHIDVLSYCQFPKTFTTLPTWVPDWNMQIRNPCAQPPWFTKFRASARTLPKQHVSQPQTGQLSIQGVSVDIIEECGDLWDPNWLQPVDHVAALSYIDNVLALCKKSPRIGMREELSDAVRIATEDAVHFNDEESDAAFPQYIQDFVEAYQSLKTSINSGKKKVAPHSWLLQSLLRLHSRRPFITRTGFVGLCPDHAAPGDLVCILFGGITPYLLRPDQEGAYTIVGEAYVHGIMYGELFKGDTASESFLLK